MTEVDKITENIEHMPVAAFIFRDEESDIVNYSSDKRLTIKIKLTRYEILKFQALRFSSSGKN